MDQFNLYLMNGNEEEQLGDLRSRDHPGASATSQAGEGLRRDQMRTLITNGLVVTADGSYPADVLVDGETIALIGADLAGAGVTADETIDATGKYVVPGGIDVHTHMELPFGGTFAKDTFETGSRGGGLRRHHDDRSTSRSQTKGQSLREGLDAWHAKAEGTRPSSTTAST